jgi:hypothetical protein
MTISVRFYRIIIGLGILSASVFLLNYKLPVHANDEIFEEIGLKNLGPQNEQCHDQNICPGMCSCRLEIRPGILTKTYNWTVYEPHSDKLFRISGRSGQLNTAYYIEGTFTFSDSQCLITFDKNSSEEFASRVNEKTSICNYQQPFCCCKTDPKTKMVTDCKRSVYYTDGWNENTMSCDAIGSGYQAYKDADGGGACQIFQDTKNEQLKAQQQAKDQAQQGTDVKYESRKLNELPFTSPQDLIGRIIQLLLGFIGSIALLLYVAAGLIWMTARGESDKIEKAKMIMFWTSAGIAAMLASYVVVASLFKLLI